MIGLMYLKELMLTKLMFYVSVLFVITGIFLREILNFSQQYVMGVMAVVQNGATWHTFNQSHSKKNLSFLYTPF